MSGFFITGTDTGVGKTYVTGLLLRALRESGRGAVGFKPIECGGREDAAALAVASGLEPAAGDLDRCNPVHFPHPLAPLAAAQLANRPVDFEAIHRAHSALAAEFDPVLVEGVGGWEVPLTGEKTGADLATELGLPVVIVVANRLGALNHTLLTVRAVQRCGLPLAGLILNHLEDERDMASISNPEILRQTLPEAPILAEILHGDTAMDPAVVMAFAGGG